VAESLGSAVLTLSVDDRQFEAGLNRARAAADGFKAALGQLGVATTIGGITAFIANQVTQLDAASAAVRTLGVDSDELGKRLRALSVELGNNISTLELTKAAYDVASSGFSSAAEATEILRASALGAKGGFAEVNDVAAALTGVLNAYGLTAADATKIVDQFVQTQADGVITVRQYAAEIGNVASIAAASGVSIEELNAAIATATLRGVPVTQTFTGLRQAISSIIKPSEQAKDLAESLGLQFNVAALQSKGLGGVLADVQAKTGGAADKIAILLGSVEAQAAIQPLLNDRLAKYNELLERQAQSAGQAASASATNSQTISGGLKQIGTGFSNLATTLDTVLTPLLGGFIKDINQILVKLNQVSALAPDKVLSREKQATDLVAGALGPLGIKGSGFFGAVKVQFDGKTFSGSATGVRESIVQYLLNKDLAKINQTQSANVQKPKDPVLTPAAVSQADAEKIKDPLLEAADAFKKAAESAEKFIDASRQLLDARLKLSETQAKPEGLNRFLAGGQDVFKRTRNAIASLAPEVEAAIKRGTELLNKQGFKADFSGIRDILRGAQSGSFASFTGLQQIQQFINDVNAEADAISGVNSAQEQVNAINKELVGVNTSLRDQIKTLVQKAWSVQVSVDAAGNSSVYGDVVNTALSPA